MNVFWTIVLGAGAVQGVFLSSALLFGRNGNRRFGLLIAALLLIFGLAIFAQLLQGEVAPDLALLIAFLNINTELTIGPVYYLIVRSLVLPQRQLRSGDFVHLLPYLLGLTYWGFAWIGVEDHHRLIRLGFDMEFPVLKFLIFKAAILFSYFIASCRLLIGAARNSQQLYAGRHRVDPTVLLQITIGLSTIPALIYSISTIDHLGYATDLDSDKIGGLLLVGVIFSVAWLLMLRPWVLSLKAEDAESHRWKQEAKGLESYLAQEKPWLDPELRFSDIASSMNWTESRLSLAIKHGMKTNFQCLLNAYRLSEFERLVHDMGSRSRDILTLAFDAGFGSKASFYRVFKEAHGTTPTQYRDSILQSLRRQASHLSR